MHGKGDSLVSSSFAPLTPIQPVILDRRKLSEEAVRAAGGAAIRSRLIMAGEPAGFSNEIAALLWDGALEVACDQAIWRERYWSRKTVQTQPADDPTLRRCARVVTMVHELHKIGYQRLRILPYWSPSGMHWRCAITHAANVDPDGFTIKVFSDERTQDAEVAHYSSAMGQDYFNWTDRAQASARELAVTFLDRFPKLVSLAQGRDWLYAGWLTDFLGQMEMAGEQGLIGFIADYPVDPSTVDPWLPPPPVVAS